MGSGELSLDDSAQGASVLTKRFKWTVGAIVRDRQHSVSDAVPAERVCSAARNRFSFGSCFPFIRTSPVAFKSKY